MRSQRHNIVCYSICWNEENLLPYYLDHYSAIAEKIIIYDNESTDSSRDIIRSFKRAELRTYQSNNEVREDLYLEIKNNCWKESRQADWVIVCDIDELLYHPFINYYLTRCKNSGISLPVPRGYQLVQENFPKTSFTKCCPRGVPEDAFNKCIIFDPSLVDEINYEPGCHTCRPTGNIKTDRSAFLKLLHAKFINREKFTKRQVDLYLRLSQINKQNKWGIHYTPNVQGHEHQFDNIMNQSRPIHLGYIL